MDELELCPFCGGKAEIKWFIGYYVRCQECHIETDLYKRKDSAIWRWNRRAGQEKK